ncbi:MAG: hypothetical protein JWM77_299 [Rhodospirillales bacterium]|nr:hypothetical protein [Rhodospirillales bacterium]
MAKPVITPDEDAERQTLSDQLLAAYAEAAAAIGAGAWSGNTEANERFTKAEGRSAVIVRRLKEITGAKGYPFD